jgi:Kef-type K+ transport system membrane component KefB
VGEPTFTSLLVVVAVAFAAPLLLGLFPGVRLPAVVLELVTGIAIGPSGLGWVEVDATIEVLAFIGLAFLLFLAGLEIDFMRLRGRVLRLAATGYALSFALALGLSIALSGAGLVDTPLFVAILLSATSLGVIISVLKDAGEISSTFGQLVIAAGTIADFGAIILLSVFFTGEGGAGATLFLIGVLVAMGAVVFLAVRGGEHSMRIARTCCGCRTRPPRSACAVRSSCSSRSRRSPRRSGSRSSSAPSPPERCSRCSTATR